MESHYVVITESSWLRSSGHGEVHGTKSESTLCEKAVSDVGEAVRRFAAEYGQATVADGRIVSGPQLLKPVDGGWEQPTEDEVSRWQKGQLPLLLLLVQVLLNLYKTVIDQGNGPVIGTLGGIEFIFGHVVGFLPLVPGAVIQSDDVILPGAVVGVQVHPGGNHLHTV